MHVLAMHFTKLPNLCAFKTARGSELQDIPGRNSLTQTKTSSSASRVQVTITNTPIKITSSPLVAVLGPVVWTPHAYYTGMNRIRHHGYRINSHQNFIKIVQLFIPVPVPNCRLFNYSCTLRGRAGLSPASAARPSLPQT